MASNVKRALVCGAGGFIGGHLVSRLKQEGYWVRGVDIKKHEFKRTDADEFMWADLRSMDSCVDALALSRTEGFDEVYQLAADMGGMGFIHSEECAIMRNNALINIYMTDRAVKMGVGKYFFSSSVCVYRDMAVGESPLFEENAVPAQPDNEYGWEKLYSERMAQAYARNYGLPVRIARFQNCYGPFGTWQGGREKAPAALCRKVAETQVNPSAVPVVEVWGDGTAVRSYTYVDDMIDGIYMLMQSDLEGPVNIGSPEYHSVDQLLDTILEVAYTRVLVKRVVGPVGVQSRNFSNSRIESIGWEAKHTLKDGIEKTYPWIKEQVHGTVAHI